MTTSTAQPSNSTAAEEQRESPEDGAQSLAARLGIKTEMGKAALRQALQNVQLFDKKQQDYGNLNIGLWAELGVVVRCTDKIMRLRNLLLNGDGTPSSRNPAVAEPLEDTFADLSNYGLIGQLIRKGIWPLVK